jgi:iron complex outermembrane receptor protein
MRVSSFQNGLVDLGLFPIGDIQTIEVLHGGQSAIHGSDAMGGVVNLIPRPQTEPFSAKLETSFGSFGYQRLRASGGGTWGDAGLRASMAEERGTEDYPFIFENGPATEEVRRTNTDFTARYGTLELFMAPGEGTRLSAFGRAYQSDRGVGGPVLGPSSSSSARQQDEDYVLQLSLDSRTGKSSVLTAGVQVHSAYQRYEDPELRAGQAVGLDTYFRNDDYRGSGTFSISPVAGLDMTLGGEIAATSADGTSMAEKVIRRHGSGFVAGKYLVVRDFSVVKEFLVYPTVRLDGFTGVSPSWSPQLALIVKFESPGALHDEPVEPFLRASASRNFRVPTFNELYFQGGGGIGNPLLKPEQARGYEVGGGVTGSFLGRQEIELSYYETSMTDRIVWVAAGSYGVTPRNIRSVMSHGIEGAWSWTPLDGPAILRASYANLTSLKTSKETADDPNVNKSLIYIPDQTLHASMEWSIPASVFGIGDLGGVIAYQYIGPRYTTEDNTDQLPEYQLVDVSLLVDWDMAPWGFSTKFDVLNLFDEDYDVVLGYPMPMRSFRLTMSVGY